MNAETNSFAEQLKLIREQKGLSQYSLAKLTGLSKQALSRLELGEREPTWATVQLIAAALGTDCRAFANPNLELPVTEPAKLPGRPRKANAEAKLTRKPVKETKSKEEK